ncbi:uncharacterized protein MONOS_18680 [Monocercomonoides exilis]|uniref:uncharacterized protein n=1 Tax=Monocercomonoides exilis TaxID=2049356 RepID=UPI00355A2502|nr:hypothetical protein MONOS_18680 [Monocercomonoides exilis]
MTDNTKKFNELFCELEHCNEEEQRQKIEEMNEIVDEMNGYEFKFIFKTKLFEKIDKMIEEKKLQLGNATWILKHIGYCVVLKNVWNRCFEESLLNKRLSNMIIYEEKKKDEKNKILSDDLCECHLLLNKCVSSELAIICVPCVLKAVLHKEKEEESQRDVEIALLAFRNTKYDFFRQELYLKEITEIIKNHQEHHNLTQLAYQSAWEFLINRFHTNIFLEDTISNELHFGREAARELEELTRNVDWNRKKGEEGGKEAKEEFALMRWVETLKIYFQSCRLKNEENVGLINLIVQIYQTAKDNYRGIRFQCIYSLRNAAEKRVVRVEDLLKSGAIDAVLEEIRHSTLKDKILSKYLQFFLNVSKKLKKKTDNKMEEVKRKATKRKVFEKMEEEGYEDTITSFHERLSFLNQKYLREFSLDISDFL